MSHWAQGTQHIYVFKTKQSDNLLSLSLSSQNTDKKETSSVSFLVLACTCWNERHGFLQRVSSIDHCDVSIPVGDSQAQRNIAALSLQPYRFENWFLIIYQSLLI